MNIFEQAARAKLRFTSVIGLLTTEDLWNLPLTSKNSVNLDAVAKQANAELKALGEESFVAVVTSPGKADAELRMEIIKHVIAVKLEQNEAKRQRTALLEEKSKLLDILSEKKDEALKTLTPEQIQARLAELSSMT